VRLGAVEEWTIRNTHEHDDHMFHIHTNPFQVIEISGQPQADRPWRDTGELRGDRRVSFGSGGLGPWPDGRRKPIGESSGSQVTGIDPVWWTP